MAGNQEMGFLIIGRILWLRRRGMGGLLIGMMARVRVMMEKLARQSRAR